ncbi:MAG: copper amine oxidase N-terminal domain-containing protein, partial [Oscillospiraceae bacterium]|nr:copper amine oxidase N-terminal domain-containing protein [Oscillospiraceae bacterium]
MFQDEINLVINGRNFTEQLQNRVYLNDEGIAFLSIYDIRELFDWTIYYDQADNQVITTANTKVATLGFDNSYMRLNDVLIRISSGAIRNDGVVYVPISEMERVYNIRVEYIEETNVVSIEDQSRGMIVANANRNVVVRLRPRRLSRQVTTLTAGQRVRGFHLTDNNWRQIKT